MIRRMTFERFLLVALLGVCTLLCIVAITYVKTARTPLRSTAADFAVTARGHDAHYSVVSGKSARPEEPETIVPITPPKHEGDEGPTSNFDGDCFDGNWDPLCEYRRQALCSTIKTAITVVLCLFGLLC
jgi:hypothetical protein